MVGISVKVNYKKVSNALNKLEKTFPNSSKAIVKEFAGEAVQISRRKYTPVRTGDLRTTNRVEEKNNKIFFVSGGIIGKGSKKKGGGRFVDYAGFQNYGTSRIEPKFFVEKSISESLRKKNSFAGKLLNSWLSNSGIK